MEWVIGAWIIAIATIVANLCAAGVIAILHAWRSKAQRGARVLLACTVVGLLPAITLVVVGLIQSGLPNSSPEEPIFVVLAVAMLLAVTMIVSLPGALIVCRKLEAPGDDFHAFE